MRTVSLLYDASTTNLSITSEHIGNEAVCGTVGDNNAIKVHIDYEGAVTGYTVSLAVGSFIQTEEHTTYTPRFMIPATADVILPEYVLSAAVTGDLPLQLYFESLTTSEHFFSANQVILKLLPAIPKPCCRTECSPECPPAVKFPSAKIIRIAYFVTDGTNSTFTWTYNNPAYMPASITVLERTDEEGRMSTDYDESKTYDEIQVEKIFTSTKVIFTLSFVPLAGRVFWIKAII